MKHSANSSRMGAMRSSLPLIGLLALAIVPGLSQLAVAQSDDWAVANAGTLRGGRVSGNPIATRSPALATHGMVATSHPLASQIALDILKQGGTAVDAAIAANAALGLMEPTGNGIGGDLFAIVWDPKDGRLRGLNASGRAPQGQSLETLETRIGALVASLDAEGAAGGDDDLATSLQERYASLDYLPDFGALSVSVPGAVDGWFELHERFGRLSMEEILQPTIDYARGGFPVTELIGYYFGVAGKWFPVYHRMGLIEEIDNYKATYWLEGRPLQEGDVFKNPDLANTLELIAKGGRAAFYHGEIADTMDAYMRRIGGPLRKIDFENHSSEWVEPQSVNYRGYDVWELPPNGQGIAALQMLNILEGFDLRAMGFGSADHLHVMAEAKKLAFEDRARFYADPEFYDVPLDTLLSKDYAAQRRALIDMERAASEVEHGDPRLVEGDTIYLTVADRDGMMVSLIQSNYRGQGSGLVPDGLGFMFQDRGALFSLDPNHPNAYAPGKRPFHTIIPAFITKNGQPWMSFGLMGGAMQPQGHAQIVVNMVDFGMGVQAAGDAARFNHTGSTQPYRRNDPMTDGGVLQLESGFSPEALQELERRGHQLRITKGPFGGYQAIFRHPETGVYWGATEMRKDGVAIGY
jgi:gamma-glutamyltranspeptidase/glutathione hydrolase